MTESANMKIWEHAQKTDPNATKDASVGGHKQTSISGYWMIQKATELWGPMGKSWGYNILDERFDVGTPIFRENKEGIEEKVADTLTHTIKLELWYLDNDKKCTIVQFGHTPYVYRSKYGPITDGEAPKKSLTDALKKALSMLGFSSDVFMGQFDDINYVEATRLEFELEKADDNDEAFLEKRQEFEAWAKAELAVYASLTNLSSLKLIYDGHTKKVKRQAHLVGLNTDAVLTRFTEELDKAKKRLEGKQP